MTEPKTPEAERRWQRVHRYRKYMTSELVKMLHDKERQIEEIKTVLKERAESA
jgi:hypothetical protein